MTEEPRKDRDGETDGEIRRRGFLSVSSLGMAGGLAAGYGAFGYFAGGFLSPSDEDGKGWQFVARVDDLNVGESRKYESPVGTTAVIARRGEGDTKDDFIALSSVCPHLGCQVNWEPQNQRFFCPCHNGVFDPAGQPVSGPPAAANQSLKEFPLKVEDGLLFIEVSLKSIL